MNKSIIPLKYSNDNTFSFERQNGPIFSSLVEIYRKTVLQNNTRNETSPKRIEFIVERKYIRKKRGKTSMNKDRTKFHDKTDFDNLLTKIQIHFLTFVIDFCNDAFRDEYKYSKDYFRNINYESKRTVNFNYITQLKNTTIKDLLKMDISTKYRKYQKSYNRELLEKIENSSPNLSELFEMSFLELFNKYYNKGIPFDEIVHKNKKINLSDATKKQSFANLIDKNKDLEKDLIDIAEKVYICQAKFEKNPFLNKKKEKIKFNVN